MRPGTIPKVCRIVLLVALSGAGGACAVRLVSEYDDTTDKEVSSLQRSVDSFLRSLARSPRPPGCSYQVRAGFYDTTLTGVSSLVLRNRARPRNTLTVQQLELLDSSLVLLERLHQGKGEGCLSPEEIEPLRGNLNTSFAAILRLELAKRRG
ncbi:MAG: hypothetical protein HY700_05275 [Gemmatimonadetes bacterium]|nr:hypothetical protein [Gemmatimonadota bacterium]